MEERTIGKKHKVLIIILCISVLIILIYKPIEKEILKCLYPCKYSEYVEEYAKEYDLDPLLIYSIIKAESNFDPESTSTSGAKGLMQLMETTAEEVAQNIMVEYDIYDVKQNIMLGTKYFSELMDNYNGNIYLSLTAYNAGMGNVAKWIENGTIKEDGSDIENIPFKETNQYVRKIIRNYRIYQEIY